MKRDHYIFDNTRNEFIKVTNSTWRVIGKILKYFAVTASLAIIYYVVFSLVISTDSEKKLKRENEMYKQMYGEMVSKEKIVGDVMEGIAQKDREIYGQLFKSDVPNYADFTIPVEFASDTVLEKDIVKNTAKKIDLLMAISRKTEENFMNIEKAYSDKKNILPPLTSPIRDFSYRRAGASLGEKINPFFKVAVQHNGMDMLAQQGDSVYAAGDGVVKDVIHSEKGLGNVVEIAHEGNYTTRYAHLEGIRVTRGQRVRRGSLLGRVGMSGNSFAPHLHYEVLRDTLRQDPANYMFGSMSADDYVNLLFMSANTGQSMD